MADDNDIFIGSSGPVFTTSAGNVSFVNTATTASSTLTNHGTDLVRDLQRHIRKLENDLALERNQNTVLLSEINELENKLSTLSERIGLDAFSDKELKIILSKIHPDKNGNKESYNELTKKINLWRSK
jgi:septal ring factor EnvC (AmiA/AmiB activator)